MKGKEESVSVGNSTTHFNRGYWPKRVRFDRVQARSLLADFVCEALGDDMLDLLVAEILIANPPRMHLVATDDKHPRLLLGAWGYTIGGDTLTTTAPIDDMARDLLSVDCGGLNSGAQIAHAKRTVDALRETAAQLTGLADEYAARIIEAARA